MLGRKCFVLAQVQGTVDEKLGDTVSLEAVRSLWVLEGIIWVFKCVCMVNA